MKFDLQLFAIVGGQNYTTLSDIKGSLDPNGMPARVINTLALDNTILNDIPFVEANGITSHLTTQAASIPVVGTRMINQGAPFNKAATRQVTDVFTLLEDNNFIDKELYNINGPAYRMNQDILKIEGFRQSAASIFMYGDSNADATKFNGLATRYHTMVGAQKGNIQYQTMSAGGTTSGSCTSAWLVAWGETNIHGIFPKGSIAGIETLDRGMLTIPDAGGNLMHGYVTNIAWRPGLAVPNYRSVVRVANLDTSANVGGIGTFETTSDTAPDIDRWMVQAEVRLPENIGGNKIWYVNDTIYAYLAAYLNNKKNVYITRQELMDKQPQIYINGIPVHRVDALLSTESVVV